MRQTRLQSAYGRYNRKYFHDRLPEKMDIQWGGPKDCLAYVASTVKYKDGKLISETPFIRISKRIRFSDTLWHFALIHEMNHLYVGRNKKHGPEFQKGMMRLARLQAFKTLW
jgi:hypothetical protein